MPSIILTSHLMILDLDVYLLVPFHSSTLLLRHSALKTNIILPGANVVVTGAGLVGVAGSRHSWLQPRWQHLPTPRQSASSLHSLRHRLSKSDAGGSGGHVPGLFTINKLADETGAYIEAQPCEGEDIRLQLLRGKLFIC